MYMHRKGHPQKCLCLRWPFCCHFHTHSHSDISPLNPLLLFLKIIFPVGQLPFWYWFHWTKYIYMPFFFFPHHFFYCFLKSLVMWVSFFFVNRKFEFKYYYTVALSSGAKENKCCNRRSFPFPLFPLPPHPPTSLLLVWHSCVTFKCRTLNSVLSGFHFHWIAATNTHTSDFLFVFPCHRYL
jgi:hypothetical protein